MLASHSSLIIWMAVAVATVGLLFRPFRIPEYVWALGAATSGCAISRRCTQRSTR